MVIIFITRSLDKEMKKRLSKSEYLSIKRVFLSLKKDPYKGKLLHVLGNVVLKELKCKSFRFYFLTSHNLIKILTVKDLEKELIKFIRMSKKSDQAKVINEIMTSLKNSDLF